MQQMHKTTKTLGDTTQNNIRQPTTKQTIPIPHHRTRIQRMHKMDNRRQTKMIRIIGYGLSITIQTIMYITFLYAYFINDMQFAITINTYNEAHIELILLPITMIISIVGYHKMIKQIEGKE